MKKSLSGASKNLIPGLVLKKNFMEPLGISAYRAATDTGLTPITISQILRGTKRVSPFVAVRLGMYFNVPASLWMELQAHIDIATEPPPQKLIKNPALDSKAFVIKSNHNNGTPKFEIKLVKRRV
jgi:addiction module HigA family antidote